MVGALSVSATDAVVVGVLVCLLEVASSKPAFWRLLVLQHFVVQDEDDVNTKMLSRRRSSLICAVARAFCAVREILTEM